MRKDTRSSPGEHASVRVLAGDLWILGRHRLVCGDSTDPRTVKRALGSLHPILMWADPPYGVRYDASWREAELGDQGNLAVGPIANDHRVDWKEAFALFPGEVAYVWHSGKHGAEVAQALRAVRFEIRAQIIWDKTRLIISRGHYHWRHEPCWYAVRRGATASWRGDRKQQTIWPVKHRRSPTGHPAEKPVALALRAIENHTVRGGAIYDPFVGTGSSIIAAEESGRICAAIEIDPAHCAVAIARWQQMTGRLARRFANSGVR